MKELLYSCRACYGRYQFRRQLIKEHGPEFRSKLWTDDRTLDSVLRELRISDDPRRDSDGGTTFDSNDLMMHNARYGLTSLAMRPPLVSSRRNNARHRGRLTKPPGWSLLKIAVWTFSPQTVESVLEPTIRDLQHEHMIALAENQPWKAKWIIFRGRFSFWSAVVAQVPVSCLRLLVKMWSGC